MGHGACGVLELCALEEELDAGRASDDADQLAMSCPNAFKSTSAGIGSSVFVVTARGPGSKYSCCPQSNQA